MKIEQIKHLVEIYPNDMELGEAVRNLYWAERQGQKPTENQLKLFDVPVDPDNDDMDGTAVLGYD